MLERVFKESEVVLITGLSRSTIRRMEKAGDFPVRKRLSAGRVGWIASEIETWLLNLAAMSPGKDIPADVKAELELIESARDFLAPPDVVKAASDLLELPASVKAELELIESARQFLGPLVVVKAADDDLDQ